MLTTISFQMCLEDNLQYMSMYWCNCSRLRITQANYCVRCTFRVHDICCCLLLTGQNATVESHVLQKENFSVCTIFLLIVPFIMKILPIYILLTFLQLLKRRGYNILMTRATTYPHINSYAPLPNCSAFLLVTVSYVVACGLLSL